MRAKKVTTWIALSVFIICIGAIIGYFIMNHDQAKKISDLASPGVSLLDLYEKNPDIVGWIRLPETGISYPVMNSDKYLHKSFDGEYEYRGTPFVMSDWTDASRNSMIYGHNMWVEKTMFNGLHKYEEKEYWEKHQIAQFFVIRDKDADPWVEKRTYRIHAVDLASTSDTLYGSAAFFDDDIDPAKGLFDEANSRSLYDTGIFWAGGDCLTLCTCSYHIKGNRDAGRILVFGTREKTEKKDLSD